MSIYPRPRVCSSPPLRPSASPCLGGIGARRQIPRSIPPLPWLCPPLRPSATRHPPDSNLHPQGIPSPPAWSPHVRYYLSHSETRVVTVQVGGFHPAVRYYLSICLSVSIHPHPPPLLGRAPPPVSNLCLSAIYGMVAAFRDEQIRG